jgi:hypothetical protein
MTLATRRDEQLLGRLRGVLPLPAHGKPALLRFLRRHARIERSSPQLTVTNIFDAGECGRPMCQFVVNGATEHAHIFVVPLAHLSFDRRHPLYRDIAAYSERRS